MYLIVYTLSLVQCICSFDVVSKNIASYTITYRSFWPSTIPTPSLCFDNTHCLLAVQQWQNVDDMFGRFDTIPECHRRTDRRRC